MTDQFTENNYLRKRINYLESLIFAIHMTIHKDETCDTRKCLVAKQMYENTKEINPW